MKKKSKKGKKCLVMLVALVMCVSAVSFAESTGRGVYTTPNPAFTDWMNSNDDFYHTHAYDKYKPENAYGLGLDVNLWNVNYGIFDKAGVEYRHDFNNEVDSVYVVGTLDLTKLYQK